jgi:hypothetical protein
MRRFIACASIAMMNWMVTGSIKAPRECLRRGASTRLRWSSDLWENHEAMPFLTLRGSHAGGARQSHPGMKESYPFVSAQALGAGSLKGAHSWIDSR